MSLFGVFRRDGFGVRLTAIALCAAVGFAIVAPAEAATGTVNPVKLTETASVSRGDFLRAVVTVLGLELPSKTQTLTTKNVSTTLRPYVQLAESRGAMKIFGANPDVTKKITRGEAVSVITEFIGARPSDKTKLTYTDVRGVLPMRAAAVTLEKKWLKPQSSTVFGWRRLLRGAEAITLLQNVLDSQPEKGTSEKYTVPIVKMRGATSIPKEEIMQTVWSLLQKEYLYENKLDDVKAGNQAVEAMVKSLQDPYTTYMPPASNQNFQNQLKGEVEGIGATVEQVEGVLRIVAPLRGSPAEKAGLKAKDEVLTVDGVSLQGLGLDESVNKIRGPKGTTVKLHIRREGIEMDIEVVRDKVTIPEVEITTQDGVGIVKIYQFGEVTDTQLRSKLKDLGSQTLRGIVLDLRSNPGGLLHAAEEVSSMFLPKGTTYVITAGRDGTDEEKTEQEPVINSAVPMVVLVNGGSASASEIVAGALQDTKRAKIVGEKTFGKGTVQQVIQFADGSSLKMTVAEWKTPLNRKIDGLGVQPDEVVPFTQGDRDAQMLRALELLR